MELDVSVYHVNTQEGSPSHFSNKSYTLIIILADNQFVHVIIKFYYEAHASSFRLTKCYFDPKRSVKLMQSRNLY